MQTFSEKTQTGLVKKFHTLLSKAGIDNNGKLDILNGYGVSSSKDLKVPELLEICDKIQSLITPDLGELDRWRKRVMASIGGYLKTKGKEHNIEIIKAIACRAAGFKSFNAIPKQQLIAVYYAFSNKQKVQKNVDDIMTGDVPKYIMVANTTAVMA